jgi:hypothetical protein
LYVASSKTPRAGKNNVVFSANTFVFDWVFVEMLAIKALFTHPNPSFFVRKGWPRSVDEHRWVLW